MTTTPHPRLSSSSPPLPVPYPVSRISSPPVSGFTRELASPPPPSPSIEHPASRIQEPESRIQYPVSNIQYPVSGIQPPVASPQHPGSSIQDPAPSIRLVPPDAEGICHLVFDQPGSSVNVFTLETLLELQRHVTCLRSASGVRGVIVRSAKPGIFLAGADLKSLAHATALAIEEMLDLGQRVFSDFAALPIPKIAAIHGACLGGGYELVLCCDYRVATEDPSTRIGLPETQLGLVPAWGGCTRLPRLIGVGGALHAILKGTQFSARAARRLGLVDEVVPPGDEVDRARRLLCDPKRGDSASRLSSIHSGGPDSSGRFRKAADGPIGQSVAALNLWESLSSSLFRLIETLKAPFIGILARRRLRAKTRGNYPALEKALHLVTRSLFRSVDVSLMAEREAFAKLVHHAETRNLIRLFFSREKAQKKMPINVSRPVPQLNHVAVIGAGVMGSGIACWLASRGKTVQLLDVNDAALAKAADTASTFFDEAVRRERMTPTEALVAHDRITLALTGGPLTHADLVIEAAVEDAGVKRRIFADLLSRTRPDTVLATNTSALPIGPLANDPRLVGLHFFNPVGAMPLVEEIRPAHANPEAVAAAVRFVQEIGKVPLVVKDSPGFLINRILLPYLLEAAKLAHDGLPVRLIDDAMRDFGMPMGPLRLLDEIGLDVALHAAHTMATVFPERVIIPAYLRTWVQHNRLGKKSGQGFYDHVGSASSRPVSPHPTHPPSQQPPPPPPHQALLTTDPLHPTDASLDPEEIAERLSLLLVNEAARCLDEGVVESADEIDLGMVLGTGFASFRGGPLRHAEQTGLPLVVGRLRHWELLAGPHYEPARPLVLLAEMNGSLFSKEDHL